MVNRPLSHAKAILRMLRAANGGCVTFRYLEAGLIGQGAKRSIVLVGTACHRARLLLPPGHAVELIPGVGYRLTTTESV